MKPLKPVLRSAFVRGFLCWLGAQYIRLVWATGRWRVIGAEHPQEFWSRGKPFILCFWHGRILMMPYSWNRRRVIHMLISSHLDGQIIARTVGHFGIRTLAGSTTRGGFAALRSMLRKLKAGESVGITPDGPKGPRMRASAGVVNLARLSGVPILPASFGVTSRRILTSWDRFVVARPFARGVIVWGQAIEVARDADEAEVERARLAIEDGLNRITAEADRHCGHAPIEPAPAAPETRP